MLQLYAGAFAIAGLIAATGPIIIHLLNRRRFRVVDWAAMDFLREAMQRSRRVLQVRDLLLLFLRVLCVVLFGLALAQPYFSRGGWGAVWPYLLALVAVPAFFAAAVAATVAHRRARRAVAGGICLAALAAATLAIFALRREGDSQQTAAASSRQPVHAILVVDDSLSMGYAGLGTTLLEEAKQRCARLIETLPGGSRISVIPLCGSRYSQEPYRTREDALDALSAIEVVDRRGTLAAAAGLALAASQKAPDVPVKRVVFLSDQQANAWPGSLAALADVPPMQIARLGGDAVENAWVEQLRLRDGVADVETPAMVLATLRYEGEQPRRGVHVTLRVDDADVASKTVDLHPGQALEVEFAHRFDLPTEPGRPAYARVEVALPPDRLAEDDQCHLVVPVVSRLPVVFVDQYGAEQEDLDKQRTGETRQLRRLLQPLAAESEVEKSLIDIRHTTLDRLCRTLPPGGDATGLVPLENARLVVLAGIERPSEEAVDILREYAWQGGQVLVAAGGDFDPQAWQAIAWRDGAGILPVPLVATVGQTPAESTGQLRPFRLDFRSLSQNQYFKVENEDDAALQSLYGAPLFFKAVSADVRPEVYDQLAAAEQTRRQQEQARIDEEQALARREAQGLLADNELARREQLRAEVARIRPDWLLWRAARLPSEAGPSPDGAANQPRVHARFTSGLPFLVERSVGQGRVMLVTTGALASQARGGWNTMSLTDAIVVYDRVLRDMLQSTLPRRNWETRGEIQLPIRSEFRRARFALTRPDGREEALSLDALSADRYGVTLRRVNARGHYEVVVRPAETADDEGLAPATLLEVPLAVTGPPQESDVRPLTVQQFERRLADAPPEFASRIRWLEPGQPLRLEAAPYQGQSVWWKALVVAVLVCLLAEMLVLALPAIKSPATEVAP